MTSAENLRGNPSGANLSDGKTFKPGKPTKYTYIVYPKSMKVPSYVDVLESQ
jgi:hypothetical protein